MRSRLVYGLLSAAGLSALVAIAALAQTGTDSTTAPTPAPPSEPTSSPQAAAPDVPEAAPSGSPVAAPPAGRGTPNQIKPMLRPMIAAPPGSAGALSAAFPSGPPPVPANAVLVITGLDKITGKPTRLAAPLNVPVRFATLTITARYCYSTPQSETPETSAFLQIEDQRPDQPPRRVFSGWMYASSPGLNGMEHPLYDVWVISCKANAPGHVIPPVASNGPVKVLSPDLTDNEGLAPLPEGSGQ